MRPTPIRTATVADHAATIETSEPLPPAASGARVFLDPADGPRSFSDRIGRLTDVRGTTAVLTLIPAHRDAEMLLQTLTDDPADIALQITTDSRGTTSVALVLNDTPRDRPIDPTAINWDDSPAPRAGLKRFAEQLGASDEPPATALPRVRWHDTPPAPALPRVNWDADATPTPDVRHLAAWLWRPDYRPADDADF
jgi:hypothetical protein